MRRTIQLAVILGLGGFALVAPQAMSATKVSVEQTCAACKAAGTKLIAKPVQSALKKDASLIGMAYLNYIYQNDLSNPHFCEAMTLMNAQVPVGTTNQYIHLFDAGMGEKTLPVLEDVQLSFDYSIGRSNPPEDKLKASIAKIQAALKK